MTDIKKRTFLRNKLHLYYLMSSFFFLHFFILFLISICMTPSPINICQTVTFLCSMSRILITEAHLTRGDVKNISGCFTRLLQGSTAPRHYFTIERGDSIVFIWWNFLTHNVTSLLFFFFLLSKYLERREVIEANLKAFTKQYPEMKAANVNTTPD